MNISSVEVTNIVILLDLIPQNQNKDFRYSIDITFMIRIFSCQVYSAMTELYVHVIHRGLTRMVGRM